MPDFNTWVSTADAIPSETRAALAWRRIQHKPTEVVFRTSAGVDLVPQTVRLESDSGASERESAAGTGPTRKIVVFGVQGHPHIADTIIAEGYRFNYMNDQYRIIDVISTIGELQGVAEANG
jgi:hypothetical protein